ncbi:hypothetical protein [Corynebacterium massiliense]|uniref:hypothetical protein n=1 Tax=Corynebacterium massiliense TaxID=441501 RepID=UPI002354DD47|nr:hypothetical protein [Corynebacterium massiliense]
MQSYPLASSYFGVRHAAVLEHPCTAVALGIPQLADAPVALDAHLRPDHRSGGWHVVTPVGVVGWLDAGEAAEFPQLELVRRRGLAPAVPVTVELVDDVVEVAVGLGLAPWQVPVNDVAVPVLSGGLGQLIDTQASADVTEADLRGVGTRQILVTLEPMGGAVLALADDRVIGTISSPALSRLCEVSGPLAARAYCADGQVAVDLPALDGGNVAAQEVPALGGEPLWPKKAELRPEWDFTPTEDVGLKSVPQGPRHGLGPGSVSYVEPEILPGAPTQTFQAVDFPTGTFESPDQVSRRITPAGPAPSTRPVEVSELAKQESMTSEFRALKAGPGTAMEQVRQRRNARRRRGGHHRR